MIIRQVHRTQLQSNFRELAYVFIRSTPTGNAPPVTGGPARPRRRSVRPS